MRMNSGVYSTTPVRLTSQGNAKINAKYLLEAQSKTGVNWADFFAKTIKEASSKRRKAKGIGNSYLSLTNGTDWLTVNNQEELESAISDLGVAWHKATRDEMEKNYALSNLIEKGEKFKIQLPDGSIGLLSDAIGPLGLNQLISVKQGKVNRTQIQNQKNKLAYIIPQEIGDYVAATFPKKVRDERKTAKKSNVVVANESWTDPAVKTETKQDKDEKKEMDKIKAKVIQIDKNDKYKANLAVKKLKKKMEEASSGLHSAVKEELEWYELYLENVDALRSINYFIKKYLEDRNITSFIFMARKK